jgi:hypothetical protein
MVVTIKDLLYERGFTIAGARKVLSRKMTLLQHFPCQLTPRKPKPSLPGRRLKSLTR